MINYYSFRKFAMS